MVSSSTVSSTVEHHNISADCLTPSPPSAANQQCLFLQGKHADKVHCIKQCRSRKLPLQVVLENGDILPLSEVCQVIPASIQHS
ncbi:hypothetical protein ID866_11825 [Astraeus odoratus]|nr:hypothetical protein ID866_11825 [Astraeus odoratus]